MSKARSQEDYVKTALRLPPDLHQAIHAAALKNERSFNGEIVALLRAALLPKGKQ